MNRRSAVAATLVACAGLAAVFAALSRDRTRTRIEWTIHDRSYEFHAPAGHHGTNITVTVGNPVKAWLGRIRIHGQPVLFRNDAGRDFLMKVGSSAPVTFVPMSVRDQFPSGAPLPENPFDAEFTSPGSTNVFHVGGDSNLRQDGVLYVLLSIPGDPDTSKDGEIRLWSSGPRNDARHLVATGRFRR